MVHVDSAAGSCALQRVNCALLFQALEAKLLLSRMQAHYRLCNLFCPLFHLGVENYHDIQGSCRLLVWRSFTILVMLLQVQVRRMLATLHSALPHLPLFTLARTGVLGGCIAHVVRMNPHSSLHT